MNEDEDRRLFDRLYDLIRLCPRHIIVRASPPESVAFAIVGELESFDQLTKWHSGIMNCKPGIWRAEAKVIPDADAVPGVDVDLEACLRWVGELDESTELDLGAPLEEWEAWERKMEKFGGKNETGNWDEDVVWKKSARHYYNYMGSYNIISTEYLTRKSAAAVLLGGDAGEEEIDDGQWSCYMGIIAENELPDRMYPISATAVGGLHCESRLHLS
jgi:hypothetical protein